MTVGDPSFQRLDEGPNVPITFVLAVVGEFLDWDPFDFTNLLLRLSNKASVEWDAGNDVETNFFSTYNAVNEHIFLKSTLHIVANLFLHFSGSTLLRRLVAVDLSTWESPRFTIPTTNDETFIHFRAKNNTPTYRNGTQVQSKLIPKGLKFVQVRLEEGGVTEKG